MLVRESISASRLERLSSRVFSGPFTCGRILHIVYKQRCNWDLHHKHTNKPTLSDYTKTVNCEQFWLSAARRHSFPFFLNTLSSRFTLTSVNLFESHTSIEFLPLIEMPGISTDVLSQRQRSCSALFTSCFSVHLDLQYLALHALFITVSFRSISNKEVIFLKF